MSTSYYNIALSSIDSNGNPCIVYPKTKASNVIMDNGSDVEYELSIIWDVLDIIKTADDVQDGPSGNICLSNNGSIISGTTDYVGHRVYICKDINTTIWGTTTINLSKGLYDIKKTLFMGTYFLVANKPNDDTVFIEKIL